MKYVYTGGPYREFRGYVFCNYRPTLISDKATEDALSRKEDFKQFDESDVMVERKESICPNCGREFKRGLTMHIRYCK